jgi:hypothetical protein
LRRDVRSDARRSPPRLRNDDARLSILGLLKRAIPSILGVAIAREM